jgi:hypothetical protein
MYSEAGGIRYGQSFWFATNCTWPFAALTVTAVQIEIGIGLGRFRMRTFTLKRSQIKSIKRKRGLFSVGIQIDHSEPEYPPFILFWTFRYDTLKREMQNLGYDMSVE